MRGIFNYFNTLFKKYDLWLFFSFIFFLIYSFYRLGAAEEYDLKFVIYVWPLPFLILNLGNVRNKVNLLDVLTITTLFLNIYFSIVYLQIYSIVITILLFLQIVYKGFRDVFEKDERESSKAFFARLNYRFPLVVLILISFSLDFIFYYVLDNTNYLFNENFSYAIRVLSMTIPIFYLVLTNFMDNKKLNLLDYLFFIFLAFMAGGIPILGFSLAYFTLPFFAVVLRSNSFEGENSFRKRNYVSSLLEKYHIIFPFLFGFFILLLLTFSYPDPLWNLSQPIYLVGIAGVCVILTSLSLLLGRFKSKDILPTDYVLLVNLHLLFFTFIYVLATALGITTREKNNTYIFSNVISLTCLGVLALGLVITLVVYYIRYKNFEKKNSKDFSLQEEYSVELSVADKPTASSLEVAYSETSSLKEEIILEENTDSLERKTGLKLTFLEELMLTTDFVKKLYMSTKNYILSFGASDKLLNNKEVFRKRGVAAEIRMDKKWFSVYLATDPKLWLERGFEVTAVPFKETPTMLTMNSKKSLKEFKSIIDDIMLHRGILRNVDYKDEDFYKDLLPNGSAILKSLGFSSDRLVDAINAKELPQDFPSHLGKRVPTQLVHDDGIEEVFENVYLDTLCNYFTSEDDIDLELLTQKKLIKNANRICVIARGTLDKPLKIYADRFDEAALKMIYITNGKAVKLLHN